MGLVTLLLLLPLLTALALLLVPGENKPLLRGISFAGSLATLVLSLVLAVLYTQRAVLGADPLAMGADTRLLFMERLPWFPSLGIQYLVGIDGISAAMLVLTGIIIFTAVLASWGIEERAKEFFVLLFVLVTGVFGVFTSFDLFLFLVCYEVAVLPMYLLIGVWGTGQRRYSAMKLTLMLLLGSSGIIVGFLALYHQSGLATFDLLALGTVDYPAGFQHWVFPAIFIGFGVIGALYPFHTWSPDGHASAPTGVSMLHAGVLMKLGGYGILRIGIYLLPEGAKYWALAFLVLTTINIVYGSLGAIRQKDLKYFTAYSSVSHCGFILFGLCTLNLMGFKGAVIQMFSHGIMTGLFFALIGMVYGRTHTRILSEMGGLGRVIPWLAVSFYIGGLASLGLPGFSGFIAELHVFLGGFFGNPWTSVTVTRSLTVIATTSIVITAVYVLRGLATVFHGPVTNPAFETLAPVLWHEKLATGILIATLAIVGLMPSTLTRLVELSLQPMMARLSGF